MSYSFKEKNFYERNHIDFLNYIKFYLPGYFHLKTVLDVSSSNDNNENLFKDCQYYTSDITSDSSSIKRNVISGKFLNFKHGLIPLHHYYLMYS